MRIVHHPAIDANHKIEGRPAQINLPPVALPPWRGDRKRRERTDEDRHWYSEQLAVQHVKLIDKSVYERVAYYASCNPDRESWASVARLGREALCSERSVRYALRRLETRGLIERIFAGGGRETARYRVGHPCKPCRAPLQEVQGTPAPLAPKVLKEGITQVQRSLKNGDSKESPGDSSESPDSAQTIDPSEKAVQEEVFPSQEQKQEKAKAPVPKKQAPVQEFAFQRIVARWFKLMRKLNYECNDSMAAAFDKLPSHQAKKVIIDGLEAEERDLAHQGKLSFAPVPKPKRLGELPATEGTAAYMDRYRIACEHVPAADLASSCARCGVYIGGA